MDVVMCMHNLIENNNNYVKTSGGFYQYYRDMPSETDNVTIADSESFKSKLKITVKTHAAGNTKDVARAVPLKYFSDFWEILNYL